MVHLDDYWWWLIAGVILAIAEILIPGIFMIWLAAAAGLTAFVVWLLYGFAPSTGLQLVIFAVLAFGSIYAGRAIMRKHPTASSDPKLNDRAARLIGEIGTVVEPLAGGAGRVQVGDSPWPATGPDIPAGERVRITGVNGTRLTVERIHPAN